MNEITIKVPPISEPAICRSCGRVFQLGDPRQQKIDRLLQALDHISGLSRALRFGGPDPMDLQDLSDALEEAVNTATDAIHEVK